MTTIETGQAQGIQAMLADTSLPLPLKKQLLMQLAQGKGKANDKIVSALLESHAAAKGEQLYGELLEKAQAELTAMRDGPLRSGTYLRTLDSGAENAGFGPRVEVLLPDGQSAFSVAADPSLAASLDCGDTVLLDAQARVVLRRQQGRYVGEQARLIRRIDDGTIEVELEHQGRFLYFASGELQRQLQEGEVEAGQAVIVCTQRRMGFCGVPPEGERSHYRFVQQGPLPDVVVERDIGCPAPFIADLTEHIRRELEEPELGRSYRLNRCRTVLLEGVSGSGKTLNIEGFVRRMHETAADITGIPLDDLPRRVARLRASEVLSKWYGEAEKNLDAFFDEVEALAEEVVRGPDGEEFELPVCVIAEEIDGLTRERGGHDATDDRVQTTILQRLETTARKLRHALVIFLFTTNVPGLVDPAFLRRAGGTTEHFGRLSRRGFVAVLQRLVRGIPFRRGTHADTPGARQAAVDQLAAWLFSPNGDAAIAELTLAGASQPETRFRRDFLTGALVERAVQEAASEACRRHGAGCEDPGLTPALLAHALDGQVQHVLRRLDVHNTHHYLSVPQGARVASVRPLPCDCVLPASLEHDV